MNFTPCFSVFLCALAVVSCAETRFLQVEVEEDLLAIANPQLSTEPQALPTPEEEATPPVGLYAPVPDCDADIAITTGFYPDGVKEWKEFVIQICDVPLDFRRVPLGLLIGSQRLGHGTMWVNLHENDDWYVIEYRVPNTETDFRKLDAEGTLGLRRTLYVLEKGLPLLIFRLPHDIQEEILSFITYPHGGFEIFLLKNNEAMARRVLRAVNAVIAAEKNKLNTLNPQ